MEFTQENLIENLVQDYLSYILKAHGLCPTILAYSYIKHIVYVLLL